MGIAQIQTFLRFRRQLAQPDLVRVMFVFLGRGGPGAYMVERLGGEKRRYGLRKAGSSEVIDRTMI